MVLLTLPDTLEHWPWPPAINPYYETVSAESAAWLRSFKAFPDKVQRPFDACNFGLLASRAYPRLSKEHIRIGCDLMNVFFVVEECTDDASPKDTAAVVDTVMDALRHPHTRRENEMPDGKLALVHEIFRQFWANAVKSASQSCQARFLATFEQYLTAVVDEARARQKTSLQGGAGQGGVEVAHTLGSYLRLRSKTVGCWPSFALLGLATEQLTDAILQHPIVETLANIACEMIFIGNDLVSYNRERAKGEMHNIVAIVLHQPPSARLNGERWLNGQTVRPRPIRTPQDAVDWVVDYHALLEKRFLQLYATLVRSAQSTAAPTLLGLSPNEIAQMLLYIDGLGNWVRANDQWSFESPRYFGSRGLEVQKTRVVELIDLGSSSQPSVPRRGLVQWIVTTLLDALHGWYKS